MNRRILGLLAAVCFVSACKEEPVGKLEPIPRPANLPAPPAQAEAPKPAPAPEPPPDPSKVMLRWKLATPSAFRLTTSTSATEAAPPAPKRKRDRKPPPPPTRTKETASTYVLQKTGTGDYTFRISPPKADGEPAQGSMSERGFVLDGLSGPLHNVSVLVLELPREAVGEGDSWSLGADLVDLSALPGFVEQQAERRNQVKLVALTPEGDGEQVATLEYDLFERVSGELRNLSAAARVQDTPADESDSPAPAARPVSSEVGVKGRGEFLVKAGRWRSWEGTLTTSTQGGAPGASGEHQLRLTPLETVPPELPPKQAKQ